MRYVIEMLPQQAERPRAVATIIYKNKKPIPQVKLVDPIKSRKAKEYIRNTLLLKYNPTMTLMPLKFRFWIYVPIPKYYTKKKRKAIEEGTLLPAKKPDVSNYLKLVEDSLNGVLYKDDSQIVVVEASKHYSDVPRIEFEVEELL